jgi:hypothetical protein
MQQPDWEWDVGRSSAGRPDSFPHPDPSLQTALIGCHRFDKALRVF